MSTSTASKRFASPRFAAAALLALFGLGGCAAIHKATAPKGSSSGISTATATTTASRPFGPSSGVAAWNGDISTGGLTAAHRSLPLGSAVRVTNLQTGQNVTVTVTSSVLAAGNRDIELSRDAAAKVGALQNGSATVLIEPLTIASSLPVSRPTTNYVLPTGGAYVSPTTTTTTSSSASLPKYDPNLSTASIPLSSVTGDVSSPARSGLSGLRYVQIGSYRDANNASKALQRLTTEGLAGGAYGTASIVPTYVGGVLYHRVRLGPIANAGLARAALEDAKKRGHGGARIMTP